MKMKLKGWAVLYVMQQLIQTISSGRETIEKAIRNILYNSSKYQSAYTQRMLRRHNIQELALARNIDGYGCWCYFDDDYRFGRGLPMNAMDEICKILHDGYKCAIVDCYTENKGDCEPWAVVYASSALSSFNGLIDACTNNNPGNLCAIRACIVEGWFANAMLDIFSSNSYDHDPLLLHANGFDPDENCFGSLPPAVEDSALQCCGDFPHRYPYQDLGGDRDCCGQVTYNTYLHECCDDDLGEIAVACN